MGLLAQLPAAGQVPAAQFAEEKVGSVLRDDINKSLTGAMKAKDQRRVSTLRMVNAAIKNADIEARAGARARSPTTTCLAFARR